MKNIFNRLDRVFEAKSFQEFFELDHKVWERMKQIARTKNYILSDYDLRTSDGKTLVTLDTDDSWAQILTYLGIEDLEQEPVRDISLSKFSKIKAYPKSNMNKVRIEGSLGAEELPTDDQIIEILTANLKAVEGRVQDKPKITKTDDAVIIDFNVVSKADEDEIKRILQTNFDKILKIRNIEVERI